MQAWSQEKCVDLFVFKNDVKNNLSTEDAILSKIDALVLTYYKIQTRQFDNDEQLQQSKENFQKILGEIISLDKKYLAVFKQKYESNYATYQTGSKSKNEQKRKSDEEKRRFIKEEARLENFTRKMIMHEIAAGKFMRGESKRSIETEITQAFAMMSTPMTQMMWARLKIAMGEKDPSKINPSFFKFGSKSEKFILNEMEFEMNPDHPVENISWFEIIDFIKGLNKLSTSSDNEIQRLLKRIIPGHMQGDIYNLPTSAQWELVATNRGQNRELHFDKADDSELQKFAWITDNSKSEEFPKGSTHAVAELSPRISHGKEFFDFEGNVFELNLDARDLSQETLGGKDPMSEVGDFRTVHGGSWNSKSTDVLLNTEVFPFSPAVGSSDVGFRLIRTRPAL